MAEHVLNYETPTTTYAGSKKGFINDMKEFDPSLTEYQCKEFLKNNKIKRRNMTDLFSCDDCDAILYRKQEKQVSLIDENKIGKIVEMLSDEHRLLKPVNEIIRIEMQKNDFNLLKKKQQIKEEALQKIKVAVLKLKLNKKSNKYQRRV